ncbi:MAG: nitrous oxide reductase family maturation protein NosD [Rhodocyclaceae bacterium]|nr:nitrous oxide reductase family maturation protein NosD [Rhodocyclaceae bacterium]
MNAWARCRRVVALGCALWWAPTAALADVDSVLKALKSTGLKTGERPAVTETESAPDPRLDFPGARMDTAAPSDAAADSWGDSTRRAAKPSAPNRTDIPWFQTLIDAAPVGSVLTVPPGEYAGPALIDKPLTIDGAGQAVIHGGGSGTVLVLQATGVTLRGLRLTASGDSHDSDDACLNVRGKHNLIEDVRMDDCLFGIDLKQSDDNTVRRTHISSKPAPLGVRGDGIRLWYSHRNLVEANEVVDSRDVVAWYSNDNVFRDNIGRRSRYSLHFMFANRNLVEGNRYYDNSVGIYVMYAGYSTIRNNVISHAAGATGMGVGMKEASDVIVENNEIIYCAVGIGSDISPFEPGTKVVFRDNRIAYNGIGISFTSDIGGTEVTGNAFEGNMSQIAVGGAGAATKSVWRGNYWDDYQGFDRDHNRTGDTPYELYAFADQLWMEQPYARFFKNAPMLEALDFLERLAPLTLPVLLLRDEAPLFTNPRETRT